MTEYWGHAALVFAATWPILNALLLAWYGRRPMMLRLSAGAALPALMAAVLVPVTDVTVTIPGALLGSEIGLDAAAKQFLLLTALLWLAAGIYAHSYIDQKQQLRFYVCFLLTLAGNVRLIIAQDLLGFYFGYALMSFAAYGLIVFEGNAGAVRAGRVYIVLMVISELLLFAAFVLAAHAAGGTSFPMVQEALGDADHRHWIIALALTGFGVKTGLLGLHVWLPLAHSQAPTPASAVLSGAMVKVGVLGWLRLIPIGVVALPDWGVVFLILGLTAAFYGVIVGVTQHSPKTVLAYSSVSQMGIMTAAVGTALPIPEMWPVVLPVITFYALQHGLNKGSLFLGAGLAGKDHRLSHWWLWSLLAVPALAIAGGPWTGGMLAKLLLKQQFHNLPSLWANTLPTVLTLASLATALLLARFLYLVRPAATSRQATGRQESPKVGLLAPWLTLLLLGQLLPWILVPELPKINVHKILSGLWPIAVAVAITMAIVRWRRLRNVREIPAGDMLLAFSPLFGRLLKYGQSIVTKMGELRLQSHMTITFVLQARLNRLAGIIEQWLNDWPVAIIVAVILAMTTVALGGLSQ